MERQEIDSLLEKYLEGETTLGEEQKLSRYFLTQTDLPPEWEAYRMLFGYMKAAREEVFEREVYLPKPKSYKWMISAVVAVAAVVVFLWVLPPSTPDTVTVSGDRETADQNTVSLLMMMSEAPKETKESLSFLGELGTLNITGKTNYIKKENQNTEQKTDTIQPLKKEEK